MLSSVLSSSNFFHEPAPNFIRTSRYSSSNHRFEVSGVECCLHQIRWSRGQPLRQAVQTNNVSMGGCATACRGRWKWITELLISGPISGSGGTLQRLLASSGRVDRIRNCQIRSNPTRDSILGNRNRACQTPRCCVQSASLTPPGAAGRCYTRFSITPSHLNSSCNHLASVTWDLLRQAFVRLQKTPKRRHGRVLQICQISQTQDTAW